MKITDKTIHILDIADDIDQEFVQILKNKGFYVKLFSTKESFFSDFEKNDTEFVIINTTQADIGIFNICSLIRIKSTVPVMIVSEKTLDDELIVAINMGCDEYIVKPVSAIELLARVYSIFRRIEYENEKNCECIYTFGDLVINLRRHEAISGSEVLRLTNKEFEVLLYLIDSSNSIASRNDMLNNIWGFPPGLIETRAIDDCIKRLRKKLADCGSNVKIETVRGHGFKITII